MRVTLRKHAHTMHSLFFGCKNENFHWKNVDIFLSQNIDCGYTLELPRGNSNEICNRKVGNEGVYISRTCFPDELV